MPGYQDTDEQLVDANVDVRPLFATLKNWEVHRRDLDLYRLETDLMRYGRIEGGLGKGVI